MLGSGTATSYIHTIKHTYSNCECSHVLGYLEGNARQWHGYKLHSYNQKVFSDTIKLHSYNQKL